MLMVETSGLVKRYYVPERAAKWKERASHKIRILLRKEERKTITAVNNVSLSVREGELFGVVGPNGAGKTTLLKLLSCVLYPDAGTAVLNGYDVIKDREMVRASLTVIIGGGWLGMDNKIPPIDQFLFFGGIFGLPKGLVLKRSDGILRLLEMEDKAREPVMFLSTGMRQKVLLGKALLIRTPVVLLDEPTISIDPRSAYVIRRYIKDKMNKEWGQTIILCTHFMHEAEMLCDRVAFINEGRLIACDTPENLKKIVAEKDALRIKVYGMRQDVEEKVKKVSGDFVVTVRISDDVLGAGEIRLMGEGVKEILPRTLDVLSGASVKVRYVKHVEPTLEDVFLELRERSRNAG